MVSYSWRIYSVSIGGSLWDLEFSEKQLQNSMIWGDLLLVLRVYSVLLVLHTQGSVFVLEAVVRCLCITCIITFA